MTAHPAEAAVIGAPPRLATTRLRILLVEDNDADAFIVEEILKRARGLDVEIERMTTLADTLERLERNGLDVVLLDLSLPDSHDYQTFQAVQAAYPHVPIIVLSAITDESESIEAVRMGAQDYLVKGTVTSESLSRAVRYAVERHRLLTALRSMSLLDELTGLYNRRGFLTLAQTHIHLSRRKGRRMLLLFGDLNGLKEINDTYGHAAGDQAIQAAGDVLRGAFRQSDLVARLGGDEFVVLAVEAGQGSDGELVRRIERGFDQWNAESALPYAVSMSIGCAVFEGETVDLLEEALRTADRELYARKRGRRSGLRWKAVPAAG